MLTGLIGGMVFLILLIIALAAAGFAFWIWMIIDCAKREFKKENEKVVWIVVVVVLGMIGATIYYFAVKFQDKNKAKKK
ncbi:MAG: PLDc N-terminal domain-containing protein [Nanoarchaeota archaeon]